MTELKSCPFCGKDEAYVQYTDDYLEWGVYCKGCKAQIYSFESEEAAIKAWNTRTPDKLTASSIVYEGTAPGAKLILQEDG